MFWLTIYCFAYIFVPKAYKTEIPKIQILKRVGTNITNMYSIIEWLIGNEDNVIIEKKNPHTFVKDDNIHLYLSYMVSITDRNYYSVLWKENFITSNNFGKEINDVISFNFGGCYMARYKHLNSYYVDHIHTGNNDKKDKWKELAKVSNYKDIILFKPYYNDIKKLTEIYGNYTNNNTWGVIDECGNCYTISVMKEVESNSPFKLIRIIQHMGDNYYNRPEDVDFREDSHFRVIYMR